MANGYNTFDLGNVLTTGENILTARQNRDVQLQQLEIQRQQQIQAELAAKQNAAYQSAQYNANQQKLSFDQGLRLQQEKRAQAEFVQKKQRDNTFALYDALSNVEANPETVNYYVPKLKEAGILNQNFDIGNLSPQEISKRAGIIRKKIEPIVRREQELMHPQQAPTTTVNVNAQPPFKVPGGYMLDPSNPNKIVPIPGGEAERNRKKSIFNSEQLKAAGYANTMIQSEKRIEELQKKGINGTNLSDYLASKAGALGQYAVSPEYQQLSQAQNDFAEANLRAKSGAAITKTDIETEHGLYFPTPGKSDKTIQQMNASRKTAIDNMIKKSGGAFEELYGKNQLNPAANTGTKKIVGSIQIPVGTPNYPNGGTLVKYEDGTLEVK